MSEAESLSADSGSSDLRLELPSGMLDALGVAVVALDTAGRFVLWSPQAEELFGYSAQEVLGQHAAQLLVHDPYVDLVAGKCEQMMETGESWAGLIPVRNKDGSTRLVEFRYNRLPDKQGDFYALGIATDASMLRKVEQDLALSTQLIAQSPVALEVLDTDLRYVAVNPAMERIHGLSAEDHLGRGFREVLPCVSVDASEAAVREVLETGRPQVDRYTIGRTPADPDNDHAWSVSVYRLEDPGGQVLGVATSVVDVTDRHGAITAAAQARQRLAQIAEGSARIGTTLDMKQTARELADVAVPELADVAVVDVLDSALDDRRPATPDSGPALFRTLAVKAAYLADAAGAAGTADQPVSYDADRLPTQCVRTGQPIMVTRVDEWDLARIARDAGAAAVLASVGIHSYLAIPLAVQGRALGVLGLMRGRNQLPFNADDVTLAAELAGRTAVSLDNARLHQSVRNTAVTLQRSLLPQPTPPESLEVATRYQPAGTSIEVGGDWFDVLPLAQDKTALVVGDVMGSGIDAAATMGRLRTATATLADLDLPPAQVLQRLDKITAGLDPYIATCIYAEYDPHSDRCRIAVAGHLPPALTPAGGPPELLDLPSGAPLGVGGVSFETTTVPLHPGDQLVLYTDGLVETRRDTIDERLDLLLRVLDGHDLSLEETCDRLLETLCDPDDHDDVSVLIARPRPRP
ncbi:SpoIIE family protein phosphatase [Streptomyces sp. NBC_01717]|uniref:SpoIIE family protein phosphatase n=1 Tax=Streptomyces sp. NBC_01717 TaxID=2975918 RepID=UPI002E368A96|nr:SpoIIE family protein phosphatase [Streptomyces sp. NBC_01717]